MIEWAKEEAKKKGRRYLRLDCDAKYPGLCAVYESAGFIRRDTRLMGKKEQFLLARYEVRLDGEV